MDWMKWVADFLAGALGAWLGALVAYRKAYSEEKGKHLATYEDIGFLLAQERGKAYEQEKGKRLATHEDIENVLKEVAAVTDKTETIKAQINSDLWKRQTFWQQKREVYAILLNSTHSLRQVQLELSAAQQWVRIGDPQRPGIAEQKFAEAAPRDTELSAALDREFGVAEIFLSEQAIALVREFRDWKRSVGSTSEVNFDKRAEIIEDWRARLIEAAREDLGAKA